MFLFRFRQHSSSDQRLVDDDAWGMGEVSSKFAISLNKQ